MASRPCKPSPEFNARMATVLRAVRWWGRWSAVWSLRLASAPKPRPAHVSRSKRMGSPAFAGGSGQIPGALGRGPPPAISPAALRGRGQRRPGHRPGVVVDQVVVASVGRGDRATAAPGSLRWFFQTGGQSCSSSTSHSIDTRRALARGATTSAGTRLPRLMYLDIALGLTPALSATLPILWDSANRRSLSLMVMRTKPLRVSLKNRHYTTDSGQSTPKIAFS